MTKLDQVAIAVQDEARSMSIVASDGAAIRLARAAIVAMREPSGEIINGHPLESAFRMLWEMTIDEILNGKPYVEA